MSRTVPRAARLSAYLAVLAVAAVGAVVAIDRWGDRARPAAAPATFVRVTPPGPSPTAGPTPTATPVPRPRVRIPRPDNPRRAVLAARWPLTEADTAFYRMVIMSDGYPGRWVRGKLRPHPLYANYLMNGFLRQGRAGDRRSLVALSAISHAVVGRMSKFRGTLVFWYTPANFPLSRVGPRAYSALTQGRYANLLALAAEALGDRQLRAAADKVFASLLVPVDDGGVLRPGRLGPVLEEEPTRVPSAILNGWLSALAALKSYAAVTGSAAAADLVRTSAREAATRLPRYEQPAYLATSYAASTLLTLRIDGPVGTTVRTAALVVDGRAIPLRLTQDGVGSDVVQVVACGRRTARGIRATCSRLRIDVPVTAGGANPVSVIRLGIEGPGGGPAEVRIRPGRYDFRHLTGRTLAGWGAPVPTRPAGSRTAVTLPVTAGALTPALLPTPFVTYGGRQVNGYHAIHISQLRVLAAEGGPAFTQHADRWLRYRCDWPGHPVYAGIPRADLACPVAAR